MNLEKNMKEDELFLEFLNHNPGAMQLYNMVQEMNNNPNPAVAMMSSARSPRKSIGMVTKNSMLPSKSPGKPSKILPIGKSPQRSVSTTSITGKSPLRSTSTNSVLGKSPARQNIAIGKSPKKSTSVTNLKPITPSRKSWGKVDNILEGRTENENPMDYNTPTKNDFEESKSKLRALGVTPLNLTAKAEEDTTKSPRIQAKTLSSRNVEPVKNVHESNGNNLAPKSPGVKKSQLTKSVKQKGGLKKKKVPKENKEPKDQNKDPKDLKLIETKDSKDTKDLINTKDLRLIETKDKKKKTSRSKAEASDEDGPPPPNFIPLPPEVEKCETTNPPPSEPFAVFAKLVNIYNGMDLSPKTSHHKSVKYAFTGSQMIDWLMENRISKTRPAAVLLGSELQRLGLFEGVSRTTEFKDSKTLYTLTAKGRAIRSGQVLQYFSLAFDTKDGVEIKDRMVQLKKLKMCFIGEELVNWFLDNRVVSSREMAVKIGKEFVDCGLIEHVSQECHFRDDRFYYSLTRDGTIQRIQASTVSTSKLEELDKLKSSEDQGMKEEQKPLAVHSKPTSKPDDTASQTSKEKPTGDEMFFSDSEEIECPIPPKVNVAALRTQLAGNLSLNSFLPGAQPPPIPKTKPVGPLERVHKIKGPANRRLPQKYTSLRSETAANGEDTFTAPISNSAKSSSSSLDEFPERSLPSEDIKHVPVSIVSNLKPTEMSKPEHPKPVESKPEPVKVFVESKPELVKHVETSKPEQHDVQEIISIPENILGLLTDENSLKNFRQYLVKNCKFHEIDYTDFLSEVHKLSKEKNVRNRTLMKREIYKTYISETSPTFLHLPIALNNNIQASMDGRALSNSLFAESSSWVSDRLSEIITEYCQLTKVATEDAVPEKKEPIKFFKPNEEDCFMYNLDFCFAVSSFKVNYLTKNPSERTEEVMNIVNKFLNEEKPKISISNPENFFNVLNSVKSGSFKIDVFDKLISDVAEALNATAKNPNEPDVGIKPVTPGRSTSRQIVAPMSTKKPLISSVSTPAKPTSYVIPTKSESIKDQAVATNVHIESKQITNNESSTKSWKPRVKATEKPENAIEKKDSTKRTDCLDIPIYIRVNEKDPKTDFVVGRAWKSHMYKLNSTETKLICYLNSSEMSELTIDLSKLTSINDIVESDQLSEPENSRYVWSILPMKLLFACSTHEERTNWISFIRSKLSFNSQNQAHITDTPVISQLPQNIPVTESTKTSVPVPVEPPKSVEVISNSLVKPQIPVEPLKPTLPTETPSKKLSSDDSLKNPVTPSGVKPASVENQSENEPERSTSYRTLRKTSQASDAGSFSIILRRFNKRGGVRVAVPDTMEKLLQTASEKLKITAVRIREVDTEAELSELNLLKPDMLVWVMTEEEEQEFL